MTTPYPIQVYDVRPTGHNSFQTLPKLGLNDLADLQAFYHFELDFTHGYHRAQPGELFWGLMGLELKAGPAVLQPQVRHEDGRLMDDINEPGILLYLSWPGAEPFPMVVDPPYEQRGTGGWTESKGSVGWGFGGESHIGDGTGGPYSVWVSSDPVTATYERRVGSDAVYCLGWWDDHIIPNPIFQVMRKGGVTPPVTDTYLVNVNENGIITGHIAFIEGPPPAEVAVLGLSQGGVIVGYISWQPGGSPSKSA